MPTKAHRVKVLVFPIVMYGCESWIIRKAKQQRIDAFKLWCWRRLLRVPWTARRSNQSILKEISLKYSLEGLMLKLKLQYLGHLIWRTDSLEKTLMLGKTEGRGRRGWDVWMASPTRWTWVWVSFKQGGLQSMGSQSCSWLSDQTELNCCWCLVAKLCLTLLRLHWLWPTRFLCPWISQARTLEWVAISLSRGYSWPRNWIWVFCIGRQILYHWATRKASMCILGLNKKKSTMDSERKISQLLEKGVTNQKSGRLGRIHPVFHIQCRVRNRGISINSWI